MHFLVALLCSSWKPEIACTVSSLQHVHHTLLRYLLAVPIIPFILVAYTEGLETGWLFLRVSLILGITFFNVVLYYPKLLEYNVCNFRVTYERRTSLVPATSP